MKSCPLFVIVDPDPDDDPDAESSIDWGGRVLADLKPHAMRAAALPTRADMRTKSVS